MHGDSKIWILPDIMEHDYMNLIEYIPVQTLSICTSFSFDNTRYILKFGSHKGAWFKLCFDILSEINSNGVEFELQ